MPAEAQNLYVAPGGSDKNAGTSDRPLATLTAARDIARKMKSRPVEVIIRRGTYFMDSALLLSEKDSRNENAALTFKGENGHQPVLNGGKLLPKFERVSEQLWRAFIPEVKRYGWTFEQLYVNGKRAKRAQAPNSGFYKPRYIRETVLQRDSILDTDFAVQKVGLPIESSVWIKNLPSAELQAAVVNFYHKWDNTIKPIQSFASADTVLFVSGQAMKPWNTITDQSLFRIENLKSALDAPGEWFLEKSGYLYYKPLSGETLENTTAIAPVLEQIITIKGESDPDKRVSYINFENITLSVSAFKMPTGGVEPMQAAADVEAAVQIDFADNITFKNCEINHTGGNAIWFRRACSNSKVEKSYLHDLGAGGIKIGETIIRENPKEISNSIIADNNIVRSGGKVFPCAVALIIFNGHDNQFTHNEVADFRYTGISVGWVWGYTPSPTKRNLIAYNHIHHLGWGELSDMGAVYTLGASEGTIVQNNVIHHIYSYDYGGWGLYTDEGSTGVIMENNLVYNCKNAGFHQHYGKENVIRNNIFANSIKGQLQGTRVEQHLSFSFSNNIIYFGSGSLFLSSWDKMNISADWNCYFDTRTAEVKFAKMNLSEWQQKGKDVHSIIADPGFINPSAFDFRFKDTGVVKKINFKPFDYTKAGVYGDESWIAKAVFDPELKKAFDLMVIQQEARNR